MQLAMNTLVGWILVTGLGLGTLHAESPLWVYVSANFQVDRSTDQLCDLLQRAKSAGYNGAVVTDYKFGKIDGRIERYYRNLQRTRQLAAELDIELIPCVMPIGYSNSILQNDPNLAAALPVKGCLFVADSDTVSVADTSNHLPGGEFEIAERNRPSGWDWVDGIRQWHTAAEKVDGVTGYMYTTWRGKYDDLEAFAELVQAK
jgi:hypothetical protein